MSKLNFDTVSSHVRSNMSSDISYTRISTVPFESFLFVMDPLEVYCVCTWIACMIQVRYSVTDHENEDDLVPKRQPKRRDLFWLYTQRG